MRKSLINALCFCLIFSQIPMNVSASSEEDYSINFMEDEEMSLTEDSDASLDLDEIDIPVESELEVQEINPEINYIEEACDESELLGSSKGFAGEKELQKIHFRFQIIMNY